MLSNTGITLPDFDTYDMVVLFDSTASNNCIYMMNAAKTMCPVVKGSYNPNFSYDAETKTITITGATCYYSVIRFHRFA